MILRNANRILELLDGSPYDFIVNHREKDLARMESFVHRTFNSDDLIYFVTALKHIYRNKGGLEHVFNKHKTADSLQPAIHELHKIFFELPHLKRTERHVSDPFKGSSAKKLNMLMRYENDRSLLIKYKMNLNRHWFDWQSMEFTWESSIWFIMVYRVLTGENVLTDEHVQVIKDMWGFNRSKRAFNIPQEDGRIKVVESEEEGIHSATLNGKPISRTWLSQKEITDGGILIFEMGPEPNKKWGTKPEDAPPSMSKK